MLLGAATTAVFVVVRFPDNAAKHFMIAHWPIAVAVIATISLGLSRLANRGRWQPFVPVLEALAIVLVPAVAVAGTATTTINPTVVLMAKVVQYNPWMLRTVTWAILAVNYGLLAHLEKRRAFAVIAATLAVLAVGNLLI
jgi:hypothetical protein